MQRFDENSNAKQDATYFFLNVRETLLEQSA